MGPDCGTAIINGVPLAFANVVNRGNIGIVAAAGTGLQEVSCIISNEGAGISQAIGTGGRDVKQEVGGIMFLEALKALAKDEQTRVILLVSKPPHQEVLEADRESDKTIRKPIVTSFIGAATNGRVLHPRRGGLDGGALGAGRNPTCGAPARRRDKEIHGWRRGGGQRKKRQKYVRGLFSGGTFCAEAQILFKNLLTDVYSNAPVGSTKQLRDSLVSQKNTVIDLGEDEFTVGRPHPMIDYSLAESPDPRGGGRPGTAVILLDVVLGYGANPDPSAELSAVIRQASRKVSVVCSITGTDQDPQNRSRVERRCAKRAQS